MKCIYCDNDYYHNSYITDIFFSKDKLCSGCRNKLILKRKNIKIHDIKVKSYYVYNDYLSDILLQYKECFDEALKDIFFYQIKDEIRLRYQGYHIVTVPSSLSKLNKRGFNHMHKMVESLKMPIIDALYMKEDISQTLKSKDKRELMINNIYLKKDIILPKKILLIDDVLTTGSSIYGSYKALKKKDNKIVSITLSYVDRI